MAQEHFPVKEKLATNLDSQIAWLAIEMGYSRDKPKDLQGNAKGYEEKLERLSRSPEHNLSVFGFMGGTYWKRFTDAQEHLIEIPEQIMVSRALQAGAKVVAGLADKVALALWLQGQAEGVNQDEATLLEHSLDMIKQRVGELSSTYTEEQLLEFNAKKPFEENPMGHAVLALHESFAQDEHDTETLRTTALDGAAAGVLMWQAYARDLVGHGFNVEMPKPGVGSGNIESWE